MDTRPPDGTTTELGSTRAVSVGLGGRLSPSGRGFGGLAFPERADGQPTYNEAYVFDGERMIPATLVDAPWLRGCNRSAKTSL